MLSPKSLLLLLSALFILPSCKHTVVEETYPDGTPKRICVYSGKGESKEIIRETTYYNNKQILMTGDFQNEKRHGRWISYYRDGKVWSEGNYMNGKRDGRTVTYFENGKVRYEGFFRQDERSGRWKFYDETGKLLKEVDYSQGK